MTMYSFMAVIVCLILAYSTYEIMLLAHLLERGPLGLGVHYGLGQFDEIINHAELQKMKMPKSKFVDDCKSPPRYDDAEAPLFGGNCAACHAGGNNAVVAEKKLKKEALTQFGMYDIEKIKTQVTNGKNAMPAFGEKLAPDDIEDVATYVLSQADKG